MLRSCLIGLACSLIAAGCGESPEAGPPPGTPSTPALSDSSLSSELVERALIVGTHPLGEDAPAAFEPVEPGESIPIVYGPQGAYMVILALDLGAWTSPQATISVSAVWEGNVVASLFYPDLNVVEEDGVLYAPNLFVITNGWEEYIEQEIRLEVRVEGSDEFGELILPVIFREPASLVGL